MTAKQIVQSVRILSKGFWRRHRTNLGLMVAAVANTGRVGVAAIGRALAVPTSPKYAIKRVDHFLSNRRFDDEKAREQHLAHVIGPRKRVLIAVDWTKIRSWSVLVAGVIQRGRAVPVLWSVMDPKVAYKSFNSLVMSIYHFLAMLVGGHARRTGLDRLFRANTVRHKPTHSDFTLGQFYLLKFQCNPLKFLRDFYAEPVPVFGG